MTLLYVVIFFVAGLVTGMWLARRNPTPPSEARAKLELNIGPVSEKR